MIRAILLAVILPGAAGPTPGPTATPKTALREIGHVHATTTFCKTFETHFNNSADALIANDEDLSFIDFTLGKIEPDYKANTGRDILLHNDRMRLAAYTQAIIRRMAALQAEINALRQTAAMTTDPATAKAARDAAQDLQTTYNHQRQLAVDTESIVHVMMEQEAADKPLRQQASIGPIAGAGDSDVNVADRRPQAEKDVREYLKFEKQRNTITDAEASAVTHAETVVSGC